MEPPRGERREMNQQQFDELMKLIDKYGDDCEAFGDYQTRSNGAAVEHSRNEIIKYIKENIMIPMAETKNALAELAEFLGKEAEHPSGSFKQKIIEKMGVDGYERYIAKKRKFAKAARIVAELAKVEESIQLARGHGKTFTHLYDFLEADKNRAVEIVRNCRVIAAEGAGDGK